MFLRSYFIGTGAQSCKWPQFVVSLEASSHDTLMLADLSLNSMQTKFSLWNLTMQTVGEKQNRTLVSSKVGKCGKHMLVAFNQSHTALVSNELYLLTKWREFERLEELGNNVIHLSYETTSWQSLLACFRRPETLFVGSNLGTPWLWAPVCQCHDRGFHHPLQADTPW